LLLDEGY